MQFKASHSASCLSLKYPTKTTVYYIKERKGKALDQIRSDSILE